MSRGLGDVYKRQEGIRSNYGANIGKVLLHTYGEDVKTKARAYAAAGSDARMNGCSLPVIICSGSGNQGITASVPVIVYARELGIDQDRLYRALLVSNLATIHQKTGIGRLSAYCGAISAGCGSGAGIAYLMGDGYEVIAHIRWSIRWRLCQVLSVMERRLPVRRRYQQQWMPVLWDMLCTSRGSSSMQGMVL